VPLAHPERMQQALLAIEDGLFTARCISYKGIGARGRR